MKTGIYYGPGDIRVEERDNPKIEEDTDIIVRVTYSCICGSDLWYWRGESPRDHGAPIGHEFMGTVEDVGDAVSKIKKGDFVISPFSISCGSCQECRIGMTSVCRNRQGWGRDGNNGGQGEMVRVPLAEGTVTVVPAKDAERVRMASLLPLTDVLCTGHHAAVSAGVNKETTVAVIGDGAVGLCAVAATKRLGAKKIILISTHKDRAAIGKQFGATDIVAARGAKAGSEIRALTNDLGVDCMLECVGTDKSWETSFASVRAGGKIGFVGVPHDVDLSITNMFTKNIGVAGGVAPAGAYIPELLPDVLAGKLDVSAIFTQEISIDNLVEGYKAMADRKTIKTLIRL